MRSVAPIAVFGILVAAVSGFAAHVTYKPTQAAIAAAPAPTPFNPRDAAVRIETPKGHGSGVVIAPGLVLTAKHVVEKAESVRVGEHGARVLWMSGKGGDIALLAADTAGRRPAEINCSAPVQGDEVVIHGNPLILRDIATHGKIASSAPQQVEELADMVVVDATINPGNSGGGVFGKDGRLVGIVDAVMLVQMNPFSPSSVTPLGLITPGSTLCKLLGRVA